MSAPPIVGVRVGELARRVGVAPETLRAWERRYGVLRPARTAGGYRVYGSADVARARRMRELIESGWAAGEAARAVNETAEPGAPATTGEADELLSALLGFDSAAGHAAFDRALGSRSLDTALSDVVLTAVREVGDRWERGEISVAQEHFASNVVRGRLLGLARGWGRGVGPVALLACLPGEQHDLGLVAFGLALRSHGWRIAYLGADTPLDTLERAAEAVEPAFVVVSATSGERIRAVASQLKAFAGRYRVGLGGSAAAAGDTKRLGVHDLRGDPVAEAARIAELEQALIE